jgi:hypothetical protein
MKQRLYGISLLVTTLATLTLSGPATAGTQVPFKGSSSGVVRVESIDFPLGQPGPPVVTTTVAGEGQATHLGRFTVTARVVIDVPNNTVLGNWVLTAANGDQLFVTFEGFALGPNQGGGNFTIVGGTGRFAGATGQYTQVIDFGSDPGLLLPGESTPYSDVITGWLSK